MTPIMEYAQFAFDLLGAAYIVAHLIIWLWPDSILGRRIPEPAETALMVPLQSMVEHLSDIRIGINTLKADVNRLTEAASRTTPDANVAADFSSVCIPTVSAVMIPIVEAKGPAKPALHPAFYVVSWVALSSMTIVFNKYILDNAGFHFPGILTCWHLLVATLMTQVLAMTTSLLDGRKTVKMTGRVYLRAIVPIGVLYSLSLVCSNATYLYLSVAFIQMLKASAPIAVLFVSYLFGVSSPTLPIIVNILFIVLGVALASFGEIKFVWIGFFYQMGGVFFEAIRLVMIQILLSGDGQNMDPLISLYYYAPVCTVMNFLVAAVTEFSSFQIADVRRVGVPTLIANAGVAFLLNVASVFLIGKTSGLVMTLCGVLKNILLVAASVVFWSTIITPLQLLGYGIALVGLVYYGVGYDGIQTYFRYTRIGADQVWNGAQAGLGRPNWGRRVLLMIVVLLLIMLGLFVTSGNTEGYVQS